MAIPLTSNDLAVLTARAGVLRSGTGRSGALFQLDEMNSDGSYIWETYESDIDSDGWAEYTSDKQ